MPFIKNTLPKVLTASPLGIFRIEAIQVKLKVHLCIRFFFLFLFFWVHLENIWCFIYMH